MICQKTVALAGFLGTGAILVALGVNGKQYVAVVVGNGGAQAATFPVLVPEIQNPPDLGAAVWVFELPDRDIANSGANSGSH